MKNIIKFSFFIFSSSLLMAMQAEPAYLYKDSRIMGMGGTDIAIGSYSTAIFTNPAGLAKIRKKEGLVVDIVGLGVDATGNTKEFLDDIDTAGDVTEELEEMLKKYSGDNFHIGVNNYSSISKHSDIFAWSVGILAAADANFMAHSNGTNSGDFIETSSRVYAGLVFGVAKPFYTNLGRIDIGLGFKYISQVSYEGTVGVYDYTNEDEPIKDYEKESSGVGFDLGISYHIINNKNWHSEFALSIMNIGLDLDKNYGHQPMTVNLGWSLSTKMKYLDIVVFGVDFVDILGANKYREYTASANGSSTQYKDYDAYDFVKNIRLGTKIGLIDTASFSSNICFGMYQQSYTAGFNTEISIVKLSFSTYQEDVGINSSTSNKDRRYMAQLGIGW